MLQRQHPWRLNPAVYFFIHLAGQSCASRIIEEARALLTAGHSAGAFYLAGYAVECALKACIAKKTREHDFPPDPKAVRDYYSHNLADLRKAAGLDARLQADAPQGSDLDRNWGLVLLWKSDSRYRTIAQQDAQDFYNAISDPDDGVLAWLQRSW